MLHKEFWGLLFLVFVGWVFLAGTPQGRIQNVCRPIGWTGNVIVSFSALVLPDQQSKLQGYFKQFEYGCQFTSWRLFYQDAYNTWLDANGGQVGPTAAPSAAPVQSAQPAPAPAPAKAEQAQSEADDDEYDGDEAEVQEGKKQ